MQGGYMNLKEEPIDCIKSVLLLFLFEKKKKTERIKPYLFVLMISSFPFSLFSSSQCLLFLFLLFCSNYGL